MRNQQETATTTRGFTFPNGGHSVHKLALSLAKLGTQMVGVVVTTASTEFQIHFSTEAGQTPFKADLLAIKLLTLGTRFQSDVNGNLSFTTDWDDIHCNPEIYGVA